MLVLYFSHSGNTRNIAGLIHRRMGGKLIEIKSVAPYPDGYESVVEQARQELQHNARPAISTRIPDLEQYHTIFIGFPDWWGTMPMPLFTFLEQYDLGSKTLIPFCTHEGSGFGHSMRDLKRLCPHAQIREGFEIRGSRAAQAGEKVDSWLRKLGLSPQ